VRRRPPKKPPIWAKNAIFEAEGGVRNPYKICNNIQKPRNRNAGIHTILIKKKNIMNH